MPFHFAVKKGHLSMCANQILCLIFRNILPSFDNPSKSTRMPLSFLVKDFKIDSSSILGLFLFLVLQYLWVPYSIYIEGLICFS